jgi:hypothetical protein
MSGPRVILFGVLCVVCVVATAGYVAFKVAGRPAAQRSDVASASSTTAAANPDTLQSILDQPHLMFVDTADPSHTRLAVTPLDAPDSNRYVTGMACDRLYFAGGRGLCSGAEEHYYGNRGLLDFDVHLQTQHRYVDVDGLSSRVRVAPDGRFASATLFVAGDSYGAPFSTRDHIFDLTSGEDLGTLEEFTVYKDGAVFQSPAFNFWGTTFARDGNTFYATLGDGSVGATTYLVQGDLANRTMQVLRTGVECPSLSPDGKRLAFKKRIADPSEWRLAVLDLTTLQDSLLNESRRLDDQVEWLDDEHVLYGMPRQATGTDLGMDVWMASTRGDEPPRRFLSDAVSPVVVR